jgi:L-threonylcarbamoyladenylate synthase
LKKKPKKLKHLNNTQPLASQPTAKDIIADAARTINKGGVVIFPTRCLYGLGADALNPAAISKVFEIKKRARHKPLSIIIKREALLPRLVKKIPSAAQKLMDRFWPGKITLVFEARPDLPEILTAGTGKIGIRLPGHPLAHALAAHTHNPITATSANISGQPGCASLSSIASSVTQQVDCVLDAGILQGGKGSTVVDITVSPPVVLREGLVSAQKILISAR